MEFVLFLMIKLVLATVLIERTYLVFGAVIPGSSIYNHMCLGNVSKDLSITNATITGMYGDIHDFAVDYVAHDVPKIYDIHRYLMKRNGIV